MALMNIQIKLTTLVSQLIVLMTVVNVLTWNVRGAMSSSLCLAKLLKQYNCDIALISEHKLKTETKMFLDSIDYQYKSVVHIETDGDSNYHCGKGGVAIVYKKSLQFHIREITETQSNRIIGIEPKHSNLPSFYLFSIYMPSDQSIDHYRQ